MTTAQPGLKKRILSALGVCLVSFGLTAVVMAVVYALRGIWPFGTDNVAYMDTAQFYIPGYYNSWAYMHQLATGTGGSWKALLYPYNWAYLMVPRDHVLEGLSLYLALHMCTIAAVAGAVLSARFPRVDGKWRVCLALAYAFSGFVLQYYSNFSWLGIVAVFPVYLLGLERLLRKGKYGLYTFMCAYFLNAGPYFAYMVLVYTVLFSLGWCLTVLPRRDWGDRLFRLGAATAAAFALCAPSWMRQAQSFTTQARFQQNLETGIVDGMTTWDITNTRHTFLMLLGLGLAMAVLLRTFSDRRRASGPLREGYRRGTRFFLYVAGMFLIPMVFTNIDTAWHFGQYNLFPMRYGYMLPATVIGFAGVALDARLDLEPAAPAKVPAALWAAVAAALAVICALMPWITSLWREYGACFLQTIGWAEYARYFAALTLCGGGAVTVYFVLLRLPRQKAAAWAAAVLVPLQMGANAFGLVAPSDDHTTTHEYDPAYIEKADSLYEYFSGQDRSPLVRTKNADSSLNAGYPTIAGVSAISSINSGASNAQLSLFRGLGYTVNYFRILDVGGTVFTDMLLGMDCAITASQPDQDLYLPGETVDGMWVSPARYGVAPVMPYDPAALEDYFELTTIPDRLNALYRAFTGAEEPLAILPETVTDVTGQGMRRYTLTLQLDGPAFLYMRADGVLINITADGKDVTVPSYGALDNRVYPAAFNANLLSLGLHGPGQVEICFSSAMDMTEKDLTLFGLDKAALDRFAQDAKKVDTAFSEDGSITVRVDAQPGQALFLSRMDPGSWRCTVNGQPVETGRFLDFMLSVPLQEGENTVVLSRGGAAAAPASIDYRVVISRVTQALIGAWVLALLAVPRLRGARAPRVLGWIAMALFAVTAACIIGFVYVAPTVSLVTNGKVIFF